MSSLTDKKVIKQTKNWISSVIVAFEFCPFAQRELDRDSIFYKVATEGLPDSGKDTWMTTALELFMTECFRLDTKPEIETSFLIFSSQFSDFPFFLEFIELANELLVAQHFEGVYQIASFHPDYCFAESSQDDASNFTNRSPYPMLHLLRESSLARVLVNYPHPENIPLHNIEKSREIGGTVFQKLLDDC